MQRCEPCPGCIRSSRHCAVMAAALTLLLSVAHAQTLTVLHNFTGGADGEQPIAGVTLDQQGPETLAPLRLKLEQEIVCLCTNREFQRKVASHSDEVQPKGNSH